MKRSRSNIESTAKLLQKNRFLKIIANKRETIDTDLCLKHSLRYQFAKVYFDTSLWARNRAGTVRILQSFFKAERFSALYGLLHRYFVQHPTQYKTKRLSKHTKSSLSALIKRKCCQIYNVYISWSGHMTHIYLPDVMKLNFLAPKSKTIWEHPSAKA